jgi:hypothetical protein
VTIVGIFLNTNLVHQAVDYRGSKITIMKTNSIKKDWSNFGNVFYIKHIRELTMYNIFM